MQLIDLTLPFGILHLPHPLFADDINVVRVLGRRVRIVEDLSAPAKHHQHDEERNDGPCDFKFRGAFDRLWNLVLGLAAVLDREGGDGAENEDRHHR